MEMAARLATMGKRIQSVWVTWVCSQGCLSLPHWHGPHIALRITVTWESRQQRGSLGSPFARSLGDKGESFQGRMNHRVNLVSAQTHCSSRAQGWPQVEIPSREC